MGNKRRTAEECCADSMIARFNDRGKVTDRRKHVSVIRNDTERKADEQSAKRMALTVHAWRRLALNLANGLAKLPDKGWTNED